MSWWHRLRYLSPAFRRADERDMQAEMESLAQIAERKELGNLTLAAENAREAWGFAWLDGALADIKYAFRILARQRSFTAVAVVSLALGIGANAAIFSLMDAVLWRDLPVRDPEHLVVFSNGSRSYFGYTRFVEGSGSVMQSVMATTGAMQRSLDAGGGPHRGNVELVSGNYFQDLGVETTLGRAIAPADDKRSDPAQVAVLSHDYWERAFGGERGAIGRTLRIEKASFTIIGVAPSEFFGVSVGEVPDVWVPVTSMPKIMAGPSWLDGKNTNFLLVLGRLQPGVSRQRAAEALSPLRIQIDIERNGPPASDAERKQVYARKLRLAEASKGISGMRDRFSKPLRVVFWMVAIGLLLACVNVMSLQFARADERRRELTVRLAIGAGRWRIARQLLAESLIVAFASGVAGLAMFRPAALALSRVLTVWGGDPLRLILPMNAPILLFVTVVSILAALVSGVGPAMRATRGAPMTGLQQGTRATSTPIRRALGRSVAVAQIALSLVLVTGACLFAYNMYRLRHFDGGLNRERLVVVEVDPADAGYKDAALVQINQRIRDRLAGLPGVQAASFSQNGLYSGRNYDTGIDADGFPHNAPGNHQAVYDHVGPYFFTAVGARILAGRDFNGRDDRSAPNVAIVSESLAKRVFQGRSPVGLNLYVATGRDKRETYQVIGVVKDIRGDVREPQPMFYLCQVQSQVQAFSTRFVVRTRKDPAGILPALRGAVREEDGALQVTDTITAEDLFDRTVDRDRLLAALGWGFGILALTLAAVGIYGLLSYDVTRRTGEIGIRMAVGAHKRDIVMLVLREVSLVCVAGLAIGVAAAAGLSKLVEGLVFGFQPGDPRVIAAAGLVLSGVALGAALIPARRAAVMDPMRALRHD